MEMRPGEPRPMKPYFVLAVSAVVLLSGCFRTGRLYPVQGPLATQTAPPIYAAKMTGAFNSGNITVTLANGEVCKGAWGLVSSKPTDTGAATNVNWSTVWDAVYGGGYYTANVLGAPLHVRSSLTGSKGTALDVEMYRRNVPGQLTEIHGVAQDSRGNIYKIVI
jgi:hypothetical protein